MRLGLGLGLVGFGSNAASGGGGGSSATWDPAGLVGGAVLSNGNLTIYGNGIVNDIGSVSTTSKSSGLYYFEWVADAQYNTDGIAIGISTNAMVAGAGLTRTGDLKWQGATVYVDNVYVGGCPSPLVGQSGAMAIDFTNRKWWGRVLPSGDWNNSGTANPATNTGGYDFPTGTTFKIIVDVPGPAQVTARFSSASWTGTPPAGFGEWT